MGVPGPTRVSISLRAAVSMSGSFFCWRLQWAGMMRQLAQQNPQAILQPIYL
jgi:hypothetical protein